MQQFWVWRNAKVNKTSRGFKMLQQKYLKFTYKPRIRCSRERALQSLANLANCAKVRWKNACSSTKGRKCMFIYEMHFQCVNAFSMRILKKRFFHCKKTGKQAALSHERARCRPVERRTSECHAGNEVSNDTHAQLEPTSEGNPYLPLLPCLDFHDESIIHGQLFGVWIVFARRALRLSKPSNRLIQPPSDRLKMYQRRNQNTCSQKIFSTILRYQTDPLRDPVFGDCSQTRIPIQNWCYWIFPGRRQVPFGRAHEKISFWNNWS